MSEPIHDPINLVGISKLINKDVIDDKIDIIAVERDIIHDNEFKKHKIIEPKQEFENMMKNIYGNNDHDSNHSDSSSSYDDIGNSLSSIEESKHNSVSSLSDALTTYSSSEESISSRSRSRSRSRHHHSRSRRHRSQKRYILSTKKSHNIHKKDNINNIVHEYAGADFNNEIESLEKTLENDEKMYLLEDIKDLEEEIDDKKFLKRMPELNQDSDIEQIKKLKGLLMAKYERTTSHSLGKECILAGAHGLEYLFDGKNEFGSYRPNLTGWHTTVRTKLNSMRYETSHVVNSVLRVLNIGSVGKILFNLVPSALLYSYRKSQQHGEPNYTPSQMAEAYDDIRQL